MDIRFGEHESFHRAAAGMVGGAFVTGVALHSVTPLAPLIGGMVGIAAGATWGYGRPALRLGAAAIAIVPMLATTMAFAQGIPQSVGLVIAASVLALGLAAGGPRGWKGALAVGMTAFVALVGMWCAMRFATARETAKVPAWLLGGISAGSMGMVGVLAMLPRHLKMATDPVATAVKNLPTTLDPEVKALCERSLAIWKTAKEELADEGGKKLVRDGVLKTLEVGAKSAEIKITGANDAELARRMSELDGKVAATTDPEAKAQYQAARAALDDQHRYREHIAKGKERLVARMHNHVAALEKFQLAATGLEAAKHTSTGDGSALKQLEELSSDVAASGEALAEVEMGAASVLSPAKIEAPAQAKAKAEPDAESGAMA
jgi:hypothetical protein